MDRASPGRAAAAPASRFVHDALFFSSTDELAAATVPFVREGLATGDAVVVTARGTTADVLRASPPRLTTSDAERISLETFGVTGTARAFVSERDQNFGIAADDIRTEEFTGY